MAATVGTKSGGGGAGKVCVACGEDVSSKPRTKDAKGRYYCQSCYDTAIAQKHSKRESTPLPKADAPPKRSKDAFGLLADDVIVPPPERPSTNMLEHLLEVEPVRGAPPMMCPKCRSSIPAGSVICTICGHNMQTGEAVGATQVKQAKPSGEAWPLVIGIISIILGAGGALVAGLALLGSIAGSSGSSAYASGASVGRIVGGMFPLLLAIWLLMAGIGIVRRNQSSVSQIKRWAITKLVIYGTCMGLMLVTMPSNPTGNPNGLPPGLSGMQGSIHLIIFLSLVWVSLWPIFVLVWFSRASVKNDVERWG